MMDDSVDKVVCSLTSAPTRRGVLAFMRAGAFGGLACALGLAERGIAKGKKRGKKRHRQRCIRSTKPFAAPSTRCTSNKQCCGGGSCCDFGEGSGCFNLQNNPTACGSSCDTAVDCTQTVADALCVDGECIF
jgi:hypothetical protein